MPKPSKQKTSTALVKVGSAVPADRSDFNQKETAEFLVAAIHDAERAFGNALRKVIVCGLLLNHTKERLDKHGEFGPWLREHCFPDLDKDQFDSAWRKANRWMDTARAMCGLLDIRHNVEFDGQPLYLILQLESCDLSKEQRAVQSRIFDFLEEKTQSQLQLEWRNADDLTPGGFRPNRAELDDWLAKHGHEKLMGQPFTQLPAKVQEAFHKWRASKLKPVDPKKQLRERYTLLIEQAHETIAKDELWTAQALTELAEAGAELGKEDRELKTIVEDLLNSGTRRNARLRDLTKGKK